MLSVGILTNLGTKLEHVMQLLSSSTWISGRGLVHELTTAQHKSAQAYEYLIFSKSAIISSLPRRVHS